MLVTLPVALAVARVKAATWLIALVIVALDVLTWAVMSARATIALGHVCLVRRCNPPAVR